jgi:hypothetical protein
MLDLGEWVARRRQAADQLRSLDARGVTPSVRDLGAALRMGRRDLVGLPWVAPPDEAVARLLAASALAADVAAVAFASSPGADPLAAGASSLASARALSDALPSTPILRLDPVTSEGQVLESRLAGADGVVLPMGFLEPAGLHRLGKAARSTLMTPIHLVRSAVEAEAALAAGARFLLVAGPDGGLAGALALAGSLPGRVSACLWCDGLEGPEAVRALAGRADAAVLDPRFPAGRWAEVAVVEGGG